MSAGRLTGASSTPGARAGAGPATTPGGGDHRAGDPPRPEPVPDPGSVREPAGEPAPGPEAGRGATASTSTSTAAAAAAAAKEDRPLVALLVAAVVAPIVVAAGQALTTRWYPAGDWASITIGVHEVGTRHTPLLGVYSRFGWNHPGPALLWLYAVPYRLSGGAFASLLLGAAAINAAAVAGAVALAWRRGRLALAVLVALALAWTVHTLGPTIVRDPWNPWVTVLPFAVLILATWLAVEGDGAGLVLVALVGSFQAQAHVGFVLLVALLGAVAVAGFVRAGGRRRTLAVAGGVLVACWLPLVAHVAGGGDNLTKLAAHFGRGEEPAGAGYAVGLVAQQLGLRGPWMGVVEHGSPADGGVIPSSWPSLIVPLVAFAAALAVSLWRWRADPGDPDRRVPVTLLAVVGVAAVGGFVSVWRITGPVYAYLVRWWWPLAALWWAAIAWALHRALVGRLPGRLRLAGVALAVVLMGRMAGTVVGADGPLLTSPDGEAAQRPLAALVDPVQQAVPRDRPVLVRSVGPGVGWVADGLALELITSGRDVWFEDEDINRFKYGWYRLDEARESQAALVLMSGIGIEELQRRGGGRMVAHWDPLTPEQRREAWDLQRTVRDQLEAAGRGDLASAVDRHTSLWDAIGLDGVDQEALARFEAYRQEGEPMAVFLYERADEAPTHT